MAFSAFTKPLAAVAFAFFSLLLCASALAEDYVPLEDVTKLEKPTLCLTRGKHAEAHRLGRPERTALDDRRLQPARQV